MSDEAKPDKPSPDLTRADFISRLMAAGWPAKEAAEEYERIQNDTEGEP